MVTRRKSTSDRFVLGFLLGILVPVIFFLIVYQMKYANMEFMTYLRNIWQMKIFLKILALCVVPNLGFFLLFFRKKQDMAARGVIAATIIYAVFILIAKLI
jgi:hypothetical protein